MTNKLDWNSNRDMWIRVLASQSDRSLDQWNSNVKELAPPDEDFLRNWLKPRGISGYAANLLVMECFGYPDFLSASADELVHAQYADRQNLRLIYDAIIQIVGRYGDFTIQTRKSYVSLVTPRRTFARIKPTTKKRVDIGLRLKEKIANDRLKPANFQKTMQVQIGLFTVEELDEEVIQLLQQAYEENL